MADLLARLRARLVEGSVPEHAPDLGPCHVWAGKPRADGYAHTRMGSGRKNKLVHRLIFELEYGPIPDELHVDHLCFNRPCGRLSHLEAVTQKENNRRRAVRVTHCPQGHPYAGENLRVNSRGGRVCRTCSKAKSVEWRRSHAT